MMCIIGALCAIGIISVVWPIITWLWHIARQAA